MKNDSILCVGITDICMDFTTYGVFFSINIFSLILNVINLFFLKKLDKSKRSAWFWTIVNIGVSDIITCLAFSLAVSCELNRLVVALPVVGSQTFLVTIAILLATSSFARLCILAIGSYERYISICHPFTVDSNKIVSNIKFCFCIVWITGLTLMTVVTVTDTGESCFGEFGAIPHGLNKQTSAVFGGSITMAFIISIFCSSKTWRELKRMQSRNTTPSQDDLTVKRYAQYILIISVAILLSYSQAVISVVFNSFDDAPKRWEYFI